MPLFAILFTLFLIALVAVGFGAGLMLVTVAAVLLYRFRPGKRGLIFGVLGGLAALFVAILIFGATWRYASWLLPPLIAEHQKFAAEQDEKPTLDPATDDVHRFVIAQAAYHAVNGFFDTPECLVRPRTCIPGYAGPPFLDADVASLGTRGGFDWSFHPGPPPPELSTMAKASPSSISTYALLGVPTGDAKRARSVCGDFRGVCTFFGRGLDGKGGCPADCIHYSWSEDTSPPLVVGFAPPRAVAGTTVTITGANLWSGGENEWRFGGVRQPYYSSHESESQVAVPKGAVTGKITITTANGTGQSASDFVVLVYTSFRTTPAGMRMSAGQTRQLAATASISDGTTADVTARASWTSSRPAVVTVDEKGLIASQAPGTARVSASFEGFTSAAVITVSPPALDHGGRHE